MGNGSDLGLADHGHAQPIYLIIVYGEAQCAFLTLNNITGWVRPRSGLKHKKMQKLLPAGAAEKHKHNRPYLAQNNQARLTKRKKAHNFGQAKQEKTERNNPG